MTDYREAEGTEKKKRKHNTGHLKKYYLYLCDLYIFFCSCYIIKLLSLNKVKKLVHCVYYSTFEQALTTPVLYIQNTCALFREQKPQ